MTNVYYTYSGARMIKKITVQTTNKVEPEIQVTTQHYIKLVEIQVTTQHYIELVDIQVTTQHYIQLVDILIR